jgi:hypothetical protein
LSRIPGLHLHRVQANPSATTLIRTRHLQELKDMEPKAQREGEEKPLTRAEAEKLVSELRDLIGDAFKNHRDGDAEEYLFREIVPMGKKGAERKRSGVGSRATTKC